MNSPDNPTPQMFAQLPQPLHFAEALLERFTALSLLRSPSALCSGLVQACAELSNGALSQFYLLDATQTRLSLCAQWYQGQLHLPDSISVPSDYSDMHLLQYCLCQNRALVMSNLDANLHSTAFLPESDGPWRSLMCLPLTDAQQHVRGLLVTASRHQRELDHKDDALQMLGNFAVAQLQLLGRPAAAATASSTSAVADITPASREHFGLIGESDGMKQVYSLISKVLHNPVTVLITGETGTGKELVARAIHDYGLRRSKPFIALNCAAMPENLLESELFGYRKGAFSGADRDHKGLFDAADGGTLFLDEIGDMPLLLQAKLLRVLQEGELRPLGSNATHKVDVRVVTATHHQLREQVQSGQFREDLFYRLTHFPIHLPPLRERGEDILLLAREFVDSACCFLERDPCRWSDAALEQLASHDFPGNVRELKGLIARALLLCDGNLLLAEHFNLPGATPDEGQLSLRERMERVERNLLIDCLRKNQGNQTSAATELGLPRRTLLYRMQRLNICPAELKASRSKTHA
ncbi:MAG: sigma 54-interacting transcriptional regulator [Pseudoalteromonas distincta]